MKHYGDITKLSGYDLPVVDCIVGGSPCQDLSVAGKRAGLAGERSGLFMEQIRIIKEMREKDGRTGRTGYLVRPRYLVWENVCGALSSGTPKGADFAAVIEEIIKVCEPDACVHVGIPDGGWTKSGCYYADDGSWSVAFRVHDAQFWGVPQRRKRISLVADFGGLSAPEILFERKGMSRDPQPCEPQGQGTPGRTEEGSGEPMPIHDQATRYSGKHGDKHDGKGNGLGIGNPGDPSPTLSGGDHHAVAYGSSPCDFSPQAVDVYNQSIDGEVSASLTAAVGGTNTSGPKVLAVDCRNGRETEINGTLQSKESGGQSVNYANIIREAISP